jgi:four helix bundle protein
MSEHHTLESLEVYQIAVKISDKAWEIFNMLSKNFQYHIGNQFLDAADSIGANIAEGYGRYHYKESINFNNFGRGSAFETKHWCNRLYKRNLIEMDIFEELNSLVTLVIQKINGYNSYLRNRLNSKK